MSTSEVPSPKGPAAVESVLLDLLDPENKPLLPQTLPLSPSMAVGSGGYNSMVQTVKGIKMALEEQLVLNLCDPELRGNVLVELSKKRVMFNDLAPLLWYSFGTIAALLQEIVSIYPALSPPTLSTCAANRACNALALLQTVAAHPETGTPFLEAGIPSYLFLFLNTTSKAKSFEYYLRITSLGVLGALVKVTLEHWSLYPIGNTWAVGLGPFLVILVLFSSGIQINSKQRKK